MELSCTQENFKRAISITERVTGKQTTLPILNNILLETENGRLKLSATNLEIGVIIKIGAKVKNDGRLAIPVKTLSMFINNLPKEDGVFFSTDGDCLVLKSGSFGAKIKGVDAGEFPIIPKINTDLLLSFSAQELKNAASKVIVCVSVGETRPELSGVNVSFQEKGIFFAATDSYRLAEAGIGVDKIKKGSEYEFFIGKNESLIIPLGTFSEILKIITPETESVSMYVGENQVFFEIDNTQIVSRLINGKYPEYKQIVPNEFNTSVIVKKEDILKAIRVSTAFSGKIGEVSLGVNSDKKIITIASQSQEIGENKTELNVDVFGQDQDVVFNPRFILDGINTIPTSKVAILINNNISPVGLRMVDEKNGNIGDDYIYIVMPVKS